jgi:hypothetical protein
VKGEMPTTGNNLLKDPSLIKQLLAGHQESHFPLALR